MAAAGFYTLETGAAQLLDALYRTSPSASASTSAPASGSASATASVWSANANASAAPRGPFELLGDSQRESAGAHADPVEFRGIRLRDWVIGSNKTHITPVESLDRVGEEAHLTPPEMVFGRNQLVLFHEPSGVCYNFLAVEALKGAHFAPPASDQASDIVENQQLKVSIAKHNTNKTEVKELNITYDWTYTTDYKGSVQRLRRREAGVERTEDVTTETTTDRINYEKLKEREPILWFEEVGLYEDELHDHGESVMNVKVRVMPSGFFVLARYWMRLDHVVVRLHETRVHHLFGSDHVIREYSRKEEQFEELFANGHPRSMANYTNIDSFQQLLPVREAVYEKILLR